RCRAESVVLVYCDLPRRPVLKKCAVAGVNNPLESRAVPTNPVGGRRWPSAPAMSVAGAASRPRPSAKARRQATVSALASVATIAPNAPERHERGFWPRSCVSLDLFEPFGSTTSDMSYRLSCLHMADVTARSALFR